MQKKTITLNGNFTSPVNVNSSLNVDGNVNVNGELIINNKSLTEILDENNSVLNTNILDVNEELGSRISVIEDKHLSSDYTAFEVFPTKMDIPAGTISDTIVYGEYWDSNTSYSIGSYILHKIQEKIYTCIKAVTSSLNIEPGVTEGWEEYWVEGNEHFDGYYYNYTVDVPANNVVNIRFHSYSKTREKCDIVIDWGDGTVSKVADLNDNSVTSFVDYEDYYNDTDKYSNLYIKHTYDNCVSRIENGKLVESKKYIVKIYGKDYCMIRCGDHDKNPIISRLFDRDLPVSSNITNLSSFCRKSLKLLHIVTPRGYLYNNIQQFNYIFDGCKNLRYANFNKITTLKRSYTFESVFRYCHNLECDINNLNSLFINGATNESSIFSYTFYECKKIYGTINPKIYWNNPNILAENKSSYCFAGCSTAIKAQAPTTWGGTKA